MPRMGKQATQVKSYMNIYFTTVHNHKNYLLFMIVYRLCLGFLDQLEQWRLEMISKAHETVAGKVL